MRSVSLFAVAVLGVILAASLLSPAAAFVGIRIAKVTTNGNTTAIFPFDASASGLGVFNLVGGGYTDFVGLSAGDYTVTENVPAGWVLTNVECVGIINVGDVSTFDYMGPGPGVTGGVTIHFVTNDQVTCTFTNSPRLPTIPSPVGGVVIPANTFAIAAPWLAVIGVVGCVGTVVVVAKKHEK